MKELTTKFGTLYIETPEDHRADKDRYVIEDSKHRWFDYFTEEGVIETWDNYETFYKELSEKISKISTPEELLDYLCIDAWIISKNWADLLKYVYGEGEYYFDEESKKYFTKTENNDIIEITEEVLLDNEYVNVIGEYYILIAD